MENLTNYAHLLDKKPVKITLFVAAAYFIFKAGTSAGEFFYYLTR